MTTKLDVHPLALAIPEMLTDEHVDLVKDINAHGLREPLVIFEGKILDGRHRYRACVRLGIEPATKDFTGTAEQAKAFVHSLNVERRHLSFEQRQKLVHVELERDPAQSDRAIAKKAKVDHKTVAKARAKANGDDPHKTERKEASGRKARGRKPVTLEGTAVTTNPRRPVPSIRRRDEKGVVEMVRWNTEYWPANRVRQLLTTLARTFLSTEDRARLSDELRDAHRLRDGREPAGSSAEHVESTGRATP